MAFENLKKDGIKYVLTRLKDYFLLIKDAVKTVNQTGPDEYGNIQIDTVPYAQNLETEFAQRFVGTYIEHTSGSSASIGNGDAWLMSVKGNSVHEGYVAESLEMTVTPIDPDSANAITATLDRTTFIQAAIISGTYAFTYTTEWDTNPASYGITVSGTPADGDVIVVVYVAEERGTIYVSNPNGMVATGWNLYNHNNGYARVLKYSDDPSECFGISGAYTAIKFSETIDGAQTTLAVNDGLFSIPSDGYVWVTGGNNTTTAIWMTWDDWAEGYEGEFEAYTEYEVDFSNELVTYFPDGLLKAGTVVDEINLNVGQAISRVERIAYSDANRAIAEASGRQYEFDEDYIYLERAEEVVNSISVDGSITANDHGMEFVTQTNIPVEVEMLYGLNLKNRLERDVVVKSTDVVNNLTTTTSGKVLDASQGKTLKDSIDNATTVSSVSSPVSWESSAVTVANCEASLYKMGKVRTLMLGMYVKNAISSFTVLGTISSGNRPPTDIVVLATQQGSSQVGYAVQIRSNGQIRMSKANASTNFSSMYYMVVTYLIP